MSYKSLAQIRFVINIPKQVVKTKGNTAALVTLILIFYLGILIVEEMTK
jgi:hypothetical protein